MTHRKALIGYCPCGSGKRYDDCCATYHHGFSRAPTPEALMRSRYSAYALDLLDYIRDSWHESTRPKLVANEDGIKWHGLVIVGAWDGQEADEGFVQFVAKYRVGGGRMERLSETSRFLRQQDRWFYVDGVHD